MQLGKENTMVMIQKTDFGVYLADHARAEEKVLLPKKWVPSDLEIGDPISVFLYKDSKGRPIATTMKPLISLGKVARLRVSAVTKIGAFLDWGLEKELLLPFREQTMQVKEGQEVLVALYLDKSERLCATMKIYPYLGTQTPYQIGDEVTGTVYEISDNFGIFVAVDDRFSALIPKREMTGSMPGVGQSVKGRISRIHEDGKMDLDLRQKAYLQITDDAGKLLRLLEDNGGRLGIHDKSSPEQIRLLTGMSKNEFKRAVGHLYRERLIRILEDGIEKA
ncbi:MAG: S1 RNA-binding domain-containing protein [Lachnospiraceae bacterium]|nr:S1 RNA-binding domain-containing protein [Lachnospiraceae bacterium]